MLNSIYFFFVFINKIVAFFFYCFQLLGSLRHIDYLCPSYTIKRILSTCFRLF